MHVCVVFICPYVWETYRTQIDTFTSPLDERPSL